jgi:Mn-dependent DtxR family transcriptional regulator
MYYLCGVLKVKPYTISASLEDYLEKILELGELDKKVRVTDIAKKNEICKSKRKSNY